MQKRVIISFGKIICGDLCRKTICLNTIYFVVNTLKNTRLKKKDGYFAIVYLTEKLLVVFGQPVAVRFEKVVAHCLDVVHGKLRLGVRVKVCRLMPENDLFKYHLFCCKYIKKYPP